MWIVDKEQSEVFDRAYLEAEAHFNRLWRELPLEDRPKGWTLFKEADDSNVIVGLFICGPMMTRLRIPILGDPEGGTPDAQVFAVEVESAMIDHFKNCGCDLIKDYFAQKEPGVWPEVHVGEIK